MTTNLKLYVNSRGLNTSSGYAVIYGKLATTKLFVFLNSENKFMLSFLPKSVIFVVSVLKSNNLLFKSFLSGAATRAVLYKKVFLKISKTPVPESLFQ